MPDASCILIVHKHKDSLKVLNLDVTGKAILNNFILNASTSFRVMKL